MCDLRTLGERGAATNAGGAWVAVSPKVPYGIHGLRQPLNLDAFGEPHKVLLRRILAKALGHELGYRQPLRRRQRRPCRQREDRVVEDGCWVALACKPIRPNLDTTPPKARQSAETEYQKYRDP